MTAPSAASHSSLGHFLAPHWKQELDETQFARALLHVAARVVEEHTTELAVPPDQKGDAA